MDLRLRYQARNSEVQQKSEAGNQYHAAFSLKLKSRLSQSDSSLESPSNPRFEESGCPFSHDNLSAQNFFRVESAFSHTCPCPRICRPNLTWSSNNQSLTCVLFRSSKFLKSYSQDNRKSGHQ